MRPDRQQIRLWARSPSFRQTYVFLEPKFHEISEIQSFANKFGLKTLQSRDSVGFQTVFEKYTHLRIDLVFIRVSNVWKYAHFQINLVFMRGSTESLVYDTL
ncbi:hypothetical protein T265_07504 [Opisthorchis viverrini]|uniref:Uncharacterized protein n=1 Tax=Opisthorchis viverrini TaxID=6198 RepID=A0A074ZNN0_OPIVI|nr:hypothetical protein T265_07504 [Opisthorchis viverrini]KER24940.1 hypothetical protein T265_07504 [Opisthorchis viverrini]